MPPNWDETLWNPFYFGRYETEVYISHCRLPALLCLLIITWLCVRHGKRAGHLVSVYIFAAYVWIFFRETVFPFPAELHLNDFPFRAFNWVPALVDGTDPEFLLGNVQVWGNFLAGIPFGFGFPFIASPIHARPNRIVAFGLAWAILPELIQFLQMWFFRFISGRTVDIDDVWLCFTGTLTGYGILCVMARLYRHLNWSRGARLPIWNHFHEVLMRVAVKPFAAPITTQNADL